MTVEEAIKRYWLTLESLGQLSVRKHSTTWLMRFLQFCHDRDVREVIDLNSGLMADFRQHLTWTPGSTGVLYSQNTLFHCQRMVRSFVTWLHDEEMLFEDLSTGWLLPRPPQVARDVPTVEGIAKLMQAANTRLRCSSLRNRAVLELLYGTGVRLAECHRLDLDSLDLEGSRLHVQGKWGKDRALPIGGHLRQILRRYLDARDKQDPPDSERALFLNNKRGRLSIPCIGITVREAARRAGLGTFGPHTLRHAFAVHLLEAGADVAYIQALLGHENIETTEIYTQVRPLELLREHKRCHPRAKRQPSGRKRNQKPSS